MTKKIQTEKRSGFCCRISKLGKNETKQNKKKLLLGSFHTRGEVTGNFLLLGFQTEPEKEKWGRKLASDLSPSRALIH